VGFDITKHTFHSTAFEQIVNDAISFFSRTPVHGLPPPGPFPGSGVYGLYIVSNDELYKKISSPNCTHPVYVGKAVPTGWRATRTRDANAPNLYNRSREHCRSIEQAANLQIDEFRCRFVILTGIEADLLVPVEAELIRRHHPLWNTIVDGFGNHDPGSGRYDQARSEWDILHPGRVWADRLRGLSPQQSEVQRKVHEYLDGLSFS
jgi:hypothetical protein